MSDDHNKKQAEKIPELIVKIEPLKEPNRPIQDGVPIRREPEIIRNDNIDLPSTIEYTKSQTQTIMHLLDQIEKK